RALRWTLHPRGGSGFCRGHQARASEGPASQSDDSLARDQHAARHGGNWDWFSLVCLDGFGLVLPCVSGWGGTGSPLCVWMGWDCFSLVCLDGVGLGLPWVSGLGGTGYRMFVSLGWRSSLLCVGMGWDWSSLVCLDGVGLVLPCVSGWGWTGSPLCVWMGWDW